MEPQPICPGCQRPLGANAPQGLCPECLLQAGLGTGVQISLETQSQTPASTPFVPPTPADLGRFFPQLEITDLLGHGGMGAVYKARQKQLDRTVALKILPPSVSRDPAFAERFAHEAKALAKLNHPNIVTLYEFGQTEGLYFFLMEFVDGVTLRRLLNAGHLAPKEALAIVPQICEALQFAHERGIVHRDIKPDNLLLSKSGQIKIADFGVAKILGPSPTQPAGAGPAPQAPALTQARGVVGTPQYMAPEQLTHPLEVDHRADIYSLGVVFYQMLTGELPGQRIEPPSRKVHIDVRLDEVVLRALEQQPERRYQQVSEVKTCVETIVGTPTPVPTVPKPNPVDSAAAAPAAVPERSPRPRLSRTALLGLCWALLPLPAGLCWSSCVVQSSDYGWGTSWLLVFLLVGCSLLTFVPGATILGWVAILQIRHAPNRLRGLALALFDGLLFPLLLLDTLIAGIALLLLRAQAAQAATPGLIPWLKYWWVPFLVLGLIVVANGFIFRRLWRETQKPLPPLSPGAFSAPAWRAGLALLVATSMLPGLFGMTALTRFWNQRIVDNVHLPFVEDPEVIGCWTTVDFVPSPRQFTPGTTLWRGNLFLKDLLLLPGGKTSMPWFTWTKGALLHANDKTASHYQIKEIDGTRYLFLEWKSGDYVFLHRQPEFYVLKWAGTITAGKLKE